MGVMSELSRLCSKLQRIGVFAFVTKNPGEPYYVRWKYSGQSWLDCNSAIFPTVKGCRDFLLTLWR